MTESGPFSGRSVLLVEDEYLAAMDMKSMLEDLGCTVTGPARNRAAVEACLAQETIDAILLDVRLKGEDEGYAIADDAGEKGIPVIFVTGYDATTFPERFRDTPHLDKPVQEDKLQKAIAGALAEK